MSERENSSITLDFGDPDSDVYVGPQSDVLFEGVMSRRVVAYFLDLLGILAIAIALTIPFFILTLGLGIFFYWGFLVAIAFAYFVLTLGGARSATPGMRAMGIQLRCLDGTRPGIGLAFVHVLCFYVIGSLTTPLILLVGLFNRRGRLVHDFVCSTVMINSADRIDRLLDD